MDIIELVARSEWPVVVAGAILLFYRPIKRLLAGISLKKIEGWGIKAEFEKGLDKVEELAPKKETLKLEEVTTYFRNRADRRTNYVDALLPFLHENVSPEAVVLDTWSRVEGDMNAMTDALQPRPAGYWTRLANFQAAAKALGLSEEEIESLMVLRQLRNKIAHSADRSLTWEDAARFKRAAERLLAKMRERWEELRKK